MNINFCPNYCYFTSNNGYYRDENGNGIGTKTKMFRADLDWNRFTDFMVKHFNDKDKVQILQFASSDGSEAYTQIITLLENYKNLDKFFPIEAYDIDKNMYEAANSGLLNMDDKDLTSFKNRNIDWGKYFKLKSDKGLEILNNTLENSKTYSASPVLIDKVNFHQGDMFEVMKNHKDDSNTVVLCRNILEYFTDREVDSFMSFAASNLKNGSLFVTGEIDEGRVDEIIQRYGFVRVLPNIYMKV